MQTTLDLYTDYLLSSFGQTTATGLSRLTDGAVGPYNHRRPHQGLDNQIPFEVYRRDYPLHAASRGII
ncbi:hypothetical protein [Spirosoma endbachense]|uniref:Uncharacterized protein n=1 Tax=Spirosoma endbachense TaxID=2666025 RepID=A0A6P1W587_9BACT|nr:hypothetical protein [Spirosoma endbachense]QHV99100.1 hypothetical protein GJR95_30635 [Spirosoma endbachense]